MRLQMRFDLYLTPASDPLVVSDLSGAPDLSFEVSTRRVEALLGVVRGALPLALTSFSSVAAPEPSALSLLARTFDHVAALAADEHPLVVVIGRSACAPAPTPLRDHRRPVLTPLERDIVRRIADGSTDKEIARALYLSRRTVQNHLSRVRDKTGLRRRADLIRWAATEL